MSYPTKPTGNYTLRDYEFAESDVFKIPMTEYLFKNGYKNAEESQTESVPDAHEQNWLFDVLHRNLKYAINLAEENKRLTALQSYDNTVVHNTQNETIAGVKTFSSTPVITSTALNINNSNDVSIQKQGSIFLRRTSSGATVLSSSNNTLYLRPKSDTDATNQVSIGTDGNVTATKFTGALTGLATNASKDANGNVINTYYEPKASVTSKGSSTVPVYFDANGVATTITSYNGNSATTTKLNNSGNQTALSAKDSKPNSGLQIYQAYNNGYPCAYGNVLSIGGAGQGQIVAEWSGSDAGIGHLYYRNKRDNNSCDWSAWKTVAFTTDNVSSATKATQDGNGNTINTYYEPKANVTTKGSATVPVYFNSSGVAVAITSYSGNSASATKATQDGNGKVISSTYATKTELENAKPLIEYY